MVHECSVVGETKAKYKWKTASDYDINDAFKCLLWGM